MKTVMHAFLTIEEEQALVEVIRSAEENTSGEIRVCLTTNRLIFRPEKHAWKVFRRLHMEATRERNAALIVMFPRLRRFVVLGDAGFSDRVHPEYWAEIATSMSGHLRNGRAFEALRDGILTLGKTMALHWPATGSNPNELDNAIETHPRFPGAG